MSPKSYTIVDVPKNLRQSKRFLNDQLSSTDTSIRFLTPMQFAFDQGSYDLVVNEASLAEMPRKTSSRYLDLIFSRLREEGTFFGRMEGPVDLTLT